MIHEVSRNLVAGNPELSSVSVDLKGLNNATVNKLSATKYLCIEGEVIFFVYQDGQFYTSKLIPGHSLTIPAGLPYVDFSAKGARMVAISRPAFDVNEVVNLPMHPKLKQYFGISEK